MTPSSAAFGEATAEHRIAAVSLSHVSIEVGHLYMEDFDLGYDELARQFHTIRPWVDAAMSTADPSTEKKRVSTCFLIDDYFAPFSSPREVIPLLLSAAASAGITIDYLAREASCVSADGIPLAQIVESRLVPDPPPGTNGARPVHFESGWLSNGQRSPASAVVQAMSTPIAWAPPVENGARNHSIFLDVELWSAPDNRRWSCSFLAAVWQLLRLGLLRFNGGAVALPVLVGEPYPLEWQQLPSVAQLSASAHPFSAYETVSVLNTRYLPVEHAVRTILSQVALNGDVLQQVAARSSAEGIALPADIVERLAYVFVNSKE